MRPLNVVAALMALGAVGPASAELIVVDGQVRVRESAAAEVPRRGASMEAVEAKFGAPASRSSAVGQPPITRWDYPSFSVYFEFDKVLHTVVHGG